MKKRSTEPLSAGADRTRILALDGLRGALALLVVVIHIGLAYPIHCQGWVAHVAVLIFFAMSGFVLARGYDGHPLAFIIRRIVRLWPLYAVCVIVGSALVGRAPSVGALFWWPLPALGTFPADNPPAWSLYYEAWATPGMLLMFIVFARSFAVGLSLAAVSVGLMLLDVRFFYAPAFLAGIVAAQFAVPFPQRIPRVLLWLGKVSFSLYLTHAIILLEAIRLFGPAAAVASFPVMLLVAWAAWWSVERPSVQWSRRCAGWAGTWPRGPGTIPLAAAGEISAKSPPP